MAVRISLFGAFTVTYGDRSVSEEDDRSKKLWKLLQYIVVNRHRQIPQKELIALLWGEEASGEDPASSLKTLLHRARNTLDRLDFDESRKLILQRSGAYYWNTALPYIVDTDEFELAASDMEKALDPEEKLNYALKAMALYKGHFLGGKYGEAWAKEPCERYRARYLDCYETAVELLSDEKRFDEIIFLSEHALEIDRSIESFHYHLISALIDKGDCSRALECYEGVLELFYNTYRKTPSDSLRSLYRSIVRSSDSVELDIAVVKEKLRAEGVDRPIFCEYDTFKLIFALGQNTAPHLAKPAYLVLLTLGGAGDDKMPAGKFLDRALSRLVSLLEHSLGQGDLCTRYSVTQMLALVHPESEDSLFAFLRQLQYDFKSTPPALPVTLTYKADVLN